MANQHRNKPTTHTTFVTIEALELPNVNDEQAMVILHSWLEAHGSSLEQFGFKFRAISIGTRRHLPITARRLS
jgi:hypothetical protein